MPVYFMGIDAFVWLYIIEFYYVIKLNIPKKLNNFLDRDI